MQKKKLGLDQQTTQVDYIIFRLPGEAALTVASLELVVSRWHTCFANLVAQHRHTLSLSSGICLETISLYNGRLLAQKKTEAASRS